jgi:hypothetical protein
LVSISLDVTPRNAHATLDVIASRNAAMEKLISALEPAISGLHSVTVELNLSNSRTHS